MGQLNIKDATSIIDELPGGSNLLAFDDRIIYKFPLTANTFNLLANAGAVVGKKAAATGAEIFNDYIENEAIYNYSTASGQGTRAAAAHQFVIGKYNSEDESLFVVGNGENGDARSNAFTVDNKGNVQCSGDIKNGNNISLQDIYNYLYVEDKTKGYIPRVYFGEDDPNNNDGNIGDIYCKIIK
jgi:hypothetical protein